MQHFHSSSPRSPDQCAAVTDTKGRMARTPPGLSDVVGYTRRSTARTRCRQFLAVSCVGVATKEHVTELVRLALTSIRKQCCGRSADEPRPQRFICALLTCQVPQASSSSIAENSWRRGTAIRLASEAKRRCESMQRLRTELASTHWARSQGQAVPSAGGQTAVAVARTRCRKSAVAQEDSLQPVAG